MTPADRPSVTDDATQRLARAAFAVDSKHHFHEGQDGRPTCSCGFVGDARKRTQTEHITAAVIEEYDAEAARRWGDRRTSDRLPMDWLDEGMASGFVLGAQWAAGRAEQIEKEDT